MLKTRYLMILLMLVPAFVSAQVNSLTIPALETPPGSQVELPILMTNEGNVVGVSFTLALPDGITVATDEYGDAIYTLNTTRIVKNFSVTAAKLDDGSWGFRIYTTSATGVIKGNEGEIMSITLNVDANLSAGEYPLTLTQNKLSVKTEGYNVESVSVDDTSAQLKIAGESAVNSLTMPTITSSAGGQVELPIHMKNEGNVVGVSFTLALPDGVTVATDEYGDAIYTLNTTRIVKNFSVTAAKLDDGSWGFRIYTTSATGVIKGNEGEIMSITLNVDANLSAGEYPLTLTQNKLSVKTEGYNVESVPVDDSNTVITVTASSLRGDVNRDGSVTIADVTALVDIILGKDPGPEYLYDHVAADVNLDTGITIADVTALVDIILGK